MTPTGPYDTVQTSLLFIRSRIGDDIDSLLPLGGQLAQNSQAYSQTLFNAGWRKLQQFLFSQNYQRLFPAGTFIIPGLPPINNPDASLQVTLSWTGYFDGFNLNHAFILPQNLIRPTHLAERPTQPGSQPNTPNTALFIDMDGPEPYIPSIPKIQRNVIWTWDEDKIKMPGSLVPMDLRVDFAAFLPDFADSGNLQSAIGFTPWYNQPILIMRAAESLASYVLAEIEKARGNVDAVTAYQNDGEQAATRDILGKATP